MSIKCQKCGGIVNSDELFCSECGTKRILNAEQGTPNHEEMTVDSSQQTADGQSVGVPISFEYAEPSRAEIEDKLTKDVTPDAPESPFSRNKENALPQRHKVTTKDSTATPSIPSAPPDNSKVPEKTDSPEVPASDCADFTIRWNQGASMFLAGTGTSLEFEIVPLEGSDLCSDFRLFTKAPGESQYSENALQFISITRPVPVNINYRPTADCVGVNQTVDFFFSYTKNGKAQWYSTHLPIDVYSAGESSDKIIENVNIKIDSITQEGKAGESHLNMLSNLTGSSKSSDELLRQIKDSGNLWIALIMIQSKPLLNSQIIQDTPRVKKRIGRLVGGVAICVIGVVLLKFLTAELGEEEFDLRQNNFSENRADQEASVTRSLKIDNGTGRKEVAVKKNIPQSVDVSVVKPKQQVDREPVPPVSVEKAYAEPAVVSEVKSQKSSVTEVVVSMDEPSVIKKKRIEHEPQPVLVATEKVISEQYHNPLVKAKLDFMISNVPNDFAIELKPKHGKDTFYNGEKISFTVNSSIDCYIAVFVVQADDSIVVLFPNKYTRTSFIKAGRSTTIPAESDREVFIEVSAPFGHDVIQVVACTELSGLHKLVDEMQPNAGDFKVVTRGLILKKVEKSLAQVHDQRALWSSDHTVITTKDR